MLRYNNLHCAQRPLSGAVITRATRCLGTGWTRENSKYASARRRAGLIAPFKLYRTQRLSVGLSPPASCIDPYMMDHRTISPSNDSHRIGSWSLSEDQRLRHAVDRFAMNWGVVARVVGTRNGEQCSKRWKNALNPHLDLGPWTNDEVSTTCEETECYPLS